MSTVNEVKPGILRTPDERFDNIPDYPFESNYADVNGLRVHFLDEGSRTARPLFLMHGEPTWSFLYRKMIPVLVDAGFRCIVPDLIGFGKSDKLARREDYTYQFHVDIMNGLVRGLNVSDAALFGQDWGGLIGIRVLCDNPERFRALVVANTGLPTGEHGATDAFKAWLEYSQTVEDFHVGGIVKGGCATELAPEVVAAYNAPFPSDEYKEAARIFPALVPITPDNPAAEANRKAWQVLRGWSGKVLTLFSDQDPVTAGGYKPFQKLLPGAKDQPHETIVGAGHFLQEDKGEIVAERMAAWLKTV